MGRDKTLNLLRQSTWFPNMAKMVTEFVETCIPCQAAMSQTRAEPLKPTELPEGPWQHLHGISELLPS